MPDEYAPTTHQALYAKVRGELHRLGPNCDLNHIQVGYITDFTDIFAETQFNGDVSRWDVARSWNFSGMFRDCPFNGDVSKWDVANAENFSNMFSNSNFNGDVSNWEVRNASNFDGDLSKWALHPDSAAVTRLLDFVAHAEPGARKNMKLPILPVEGFRLFLDRNTMNAWLAERASQNDIDRYHWDALLRAPEAPWATAQMRQHMQTYTTLMGLALTSKEDLPEPCLEEGPAQ